MNYGMFLDEYGNQVEKTKFEFPYSYDGFVIWQKNLIVNPTYTVYSDRILREDFKRHNQICLEIFGDEGQYWDRRDPKLIEKFLSKFSGVNVELLRVMEYCNISTGYPLWRFDYNGLGIADGGALKHQSL